MNSLNALLFLKEGANTRDHSGDFVIRKLALERGHQFAFSVFCHVDECGIGSRLLPIRVGEIRLPFRAVIRKAATVFAMTHRALCQIDRVTIGNRSPGDTVSRAADNQSIRRDNDGENKRCKLCTILHIYVSLSLVELSSWNQSEVSSAVAPAGLDH